MAAATWRNASSARSCRATSATTSSDSTTCRRRSATRLPANITVEEFYLQSGALLNSSQAQRHYASLDYTHVARALGDRGVNCIVQKVAVNEDGTRLVAVVEHRPDLRRDRCDRRGRVAAAAAGGGNRPATAVARRRGRGRDGFLRHRDRAAGPVSAAVRDCRGNRSAMPITRSACTPARWCATAAPCRSASARCPTRCAMRWCCATPTTPPIAACCRRWIRNSNGIRRWSPAAGSIRCPKACTAAAR